MAKLPIDIWSDLVCPWCYIGKRRFEAAISRFSARDDVALTWRAFELDPRAPRVFAIEETQAQRLAKKYGRSVKEAQAMIDRVKDVARAEGLDFDFDRIRPGNTFDGHRLVHFGRAHGLEGALEERLMRAHFCEGEAIGEAETLVRLAGEVGLDAERVRAMLASDELGDAVRAEEREARERGIQGVPFFVIGERYAVSGAQPVEVFLGALERAWDELGPAALAEDAVCGSNGC